VKNPKWGHILIVEIPSMSMVKESFYANIQSKHAEQGRKVIELPPEVRKKFKPGDHVKVTVEST